MRASRDPRKNASLQRKTSNAKRRGKLRRRFTHMLNAIGAAGALASAIAFNLLLFPEAVAPDASAASITVGEPVMTAKAEPRPEDVRLLAATAWAEARSEGTEGMRAVAHVIVNRIGPRFGENVRTVVLTPWQFSAWNQGDPNRPLALHPERYAGGGVNKATWSEAQAIARDVLSGRSVDPTGGSLFYHTRAVHPSWALHGVGRQVIGAHVFYRDVPDLTPRRAPPILTAENEGPSAAPAATASRPPAQARIQRRAQLAARQRAAEERVSGVLAETPAREADAT